MSVEEPYIARCGWCEQGLVRLHRCQECGATVAICDECERTWRDPAAIHADSRAKSNGAHPNCPFCPNGDVTWARLTEEEIEQEGLTSLVIGQST